MPSNQTHFLKAAWFVFAGALLLRLYHLDLPFLEPYNNLTRQVVSGMMSRNFYRHGFCFWYPELDQGPGPYLFNAEMPIGPYLAALFYKLAGGAHEWADRLVSVCASMGMLWGLHSFTKRAYDAQTAFWALVFAAFSPLGVAFSRAAQPDMLMLAGSVCGLYAFYRYHEEGKIKYFVLSVLMIFLAVASKAYTLYLFLPLFVMAWRYQGKNLFSDPKNYLYAAVVLSTLCWYGYMWHEGKTQALFYDTIRYNRGVDNGGVAVLFSPEHLGLFTKIFFVHILTPAGGMFFLMGLFGHSEKKENLFFLAWLGSVALFVLVTWRIVMRNPYYELALLPPAAVFAGRGLTAALSWKKTLAAAAALTAIPVALHFYHGLYFLPPEREAVLAAGNAAEQYTDKEKLIIASYEAHPALLYYSDRRGWEFDAARPMGVLVAELEKHRAQGAASFVTLPQYLSRTDPAFEEYLRAHYKVTHESAGDLIFDLAGKA